MEYKDMHKTKKYLCVEIAGWDEYIIDERSQMMQAHVGDEFSDTLRLLSFIRVAPGGVQHSFDCEDAFESPNKIIGCYVKYRYYTELSSSYNENDKEKGKILNAYTGTFEELENGIRQGLDWLADDGI